MFEKNIIVKMINMIRSYKKKVTQYTFYTGSVRDLTN